VLDALQEHYQDQSVQVLSFSFDHSEKIHEEFITEHGFRFPSIFARKGEGLRVVKMLQKGTGTLEAVPTVLIYDKRARLTHHLVGFFNRRQLEDLIAPLLDE
jgi:peroxiredoxin